MRCGAVRRRQKSSSCGHFGCSRGVLANSRPHPSLKTLRSAVELRQPAIPNYYEPSATRMYAGDFGLRTVPVIGRILQPCVGPGEAQSGRR